MALEQDLHTGSALPQGWEEHQKGMIDEFFDERVPDALKEREDREIGFISKGCGPSDCLEYAKFLMQGMPIAVDTHQGHNSYTLICPGRGRVIQFRTEELNVKAIDEARLMYGNLVSKAIRHHAFVLPVYTFKILPGHLHTWQHIDRHPFPLEREMKTVTDLAKFIATASHFSYFSDRYDDSSWTMSANTSLQWLEENQNLMEMAPEVHAQIASLRTRLHLLDTLPAVLTHPNLTSPNVFVEKDTGNLTGVINFDKSRTEAFGMSIFALYETFFASMDDGHWSPYDMPAGEQYPGLSVIELLSRAFWISLWANVAPGLERKTNGEAVGVALRVGVINRYFESALDEMDTEATFHQVSLNYARDILQYLEDTGV